MKFLFCLVFLLLPIFITGADAIAQSYGWEQDGTQGREESSRHSPQTMRSGLLKVASFTVSSEITEVSSLDYSRARPVTNPMEIRSIDEGKSADFTVRLSEKPKKNTTVTLSPGKQLTLNKTSLTFTPRNWAVPQQVTLTSVEDDVVSEFQQNYFNINLSASPGGGEDRLVVFVDDNDEGNVIIQPATRRIPFLREGKDPQKFTVRLSGKPAVNVIFDLSHEPGKITLDKSTLKFTPENYSTGQEVTVTAVDNDITDVHSAEWVRISLSVQEGGYYYGPSSNLIVDVNVWDDDVPGLVVEPTQINPLTEGEDTTFSVKLATKPSVNVNVSITKNTNHSLGLTLSESTLEFTATNWNKKQKITVTAPDNDKINTSTDDWERIVVASSGGEYSAHSQVVSIYVVDNETGKLVIEPTEIRSLGEGQSKTFTVKLSVQPRSDVAVGLQPSSTRFTLDKTKLTFTQTDWGNTQTVTVKAFRNSVSGDNDNEQVVFLRSSGGGYSDEKSVRVFLEDGDLLRLTVEKSTRCVEGELCGMKVSLPAQPSADVTLSVVVPTGSDLTATPLTHVFSAVGWESEQATIVMYAGQDEDFVDDTDEIRLVAKGGNYNVVQSVSITVNDDDKYALVIDPQTIEVLEGTSIPFNISLWSQPSSNVTVRATRIAKNPGSANLVFTPQNFSVPQKMYYTPGEDDNLLDDTRTMTISAFGGGYDGVTGTVRIKIKDNDTAELRISATHVELSEGSQKDITLSLSNEPSADVTVMISGHADTDVVPGKTVYTFTDANWKIPQTVQLQANEDDDFQENAPVNLDFSGSDGGFSGTSARVTVVIKENDTASLVGLPTEPVSVPEGGQNSFSLGLSAQPNSDVTITVTGHDGTDLTPSPTSLIFTFNTWKTKKEITVTAAEDEDLINDTVTLTLTVSGGGYDLNQQVSVIITDDTVILLAPSEVEINEGEAKDITIGPGAAPSGAVAVDISGYTGLTLSTSRLSFTSTDWAGKSVRLTALKDDDLADDEVQIVLTASGGGYNLTRQITVTIKDVDSPGLVIPSTLSVSEGETGSLSVALTAQPSAPVTVTFTGYTGTALTLGTTQLTFEKANWKIPQLVSLSVSEDDNFLNETETLTLTASGGGYNLNQQITVTITDDDDVQVQAPETVEIPEGEKKDISIALLAQPSEDVTITLTGYSGTELGLSTSSLRFTPTVSVRKYHIA